MENFKLMRCAFTFQGKHYLSPSKREARAFLKTFGEKDTPRRFETNWRFKTIERAPSYCQMMVIKLDKVEFRSF